jgi:hypothetical protein
LYRRTPIEDELQLDELHVDDIRRNGFMAKSHAEVLYLDEVSLQGVFESIFENNEFGYLWQAVRTEDLMNRKTVPESTFPQ